MQIADIFEDAKQTIGSKGVFGTPYEKNGLTVIPAARIMGGAGGGEGQMPAESDDGVETTRSTGSGGGFGVSGQPTGAFVIKGEDVKWVPAVDVNRLMVGFQVVLVVFFVALRSIFRARAAATRAGSEGVS